MIRTKSPERAKPPSPRKTVEQKKEGQSSSKRVEFSFSGQSLLSGDQREKLSHLSDDELKNFEPRSLDEAKKVERIVERRKQLRPQYRWLQPIEKRLKHILNQMSQNGTRVSPEDAAAQYAYELKEAMPKEGNHEMPTAINAVVAPGGHVFLGQNAKNPHETARRVKLAPEQFRTNYNKTMKENPEGYTEIERHLFNCAEFYPMSKGLESTGDVNKLRSYAMGWNGSDYKYMQMCENCHQMYKTKDVVEKWDEQEKLRLAKQEEAEKQQAAELERQRAEVRKRNEQALSTRNKTTDNIAPIAQRIKDNKLPAAPKDILAMLAIRGSDAVEKYIQDELKKRPNKGDKKQTRR